MPKDTYQLACNAIRHCILYSATQKVFGYGKTDTLPLKPHVVFTDQTPVAGDLVRIEFARATKWDLSWFESKVGYAFNLRSIEDRALSDWSNIELSVFDREMVEKHPEWRWCDAQFKIWQWMIKAYTSYAIRPMMPVYDGDRVQLRTRAVFSQDVICDGLFFENWRKLKYRDVIAFRDGKINGDGTKVES